MKPDNILKTDHELPDQLSQFVATPACSRLLWTTVENLGADQDPWLTHWLNRPAFGIGIGIGIGIGSMPIDIAGLRSSGATS